MSNGKSKVDVSMILRLAVAAYLLYMLFNVVYAYIQGGPDAPSVQTLWMAIAVLGGGAALISFLSYLAWKNTKKRREALEKKRLEKEQQKALEETEE